MLGLFGTLNLGTRSLATQQQGTEVAGHNLANVNTPGYARQRLSITTGITVPSSVGPQGTGSDAIGIRQLRDAVMDRQILNENSTRGALDARQQGLQYTQASLGQQIDRQSATPTDGSASSEGQHGLAEEMSDLFNAFQSVSTNTTDLAERQVLMLKAQNLATQFNQVANRLDGVRDGLNEAITSDVSAANLLLSDIAKLNGEIVKAEVGVDGRANDLRDVRQQRLEELAKLTSFNSVESPNGSVNVTIDGQSVVTGSVLDDTLEAYDAGGGQFLIRTATGQTSLNLTGGSIQGSIDVRDTGLAKVRSDVDQLATNFITSVNAVHATGFSLTGSTGADFFTGTDASTIRANAALVTDPRLIQAGATSGAVGDNKVMLQLAQLAEAPQAGLNNQSFSSYYNESVAAMGQELKSVNTQIGNQEIVQNMLVRQRDSVMGVSIDEEMTDLIKYQKAYQASAKLINTVDEMLDILMTLKR
jgi:flagellar hook-associated protein 1 FlgK